MTQKPWDVRTCLWFNTRGEAAAELYVSLVPNSEIERVSRPGPEGGVTIIDFRLARTPYMILDVGPAEPRFGHSEAASIHIVTPDQAATDHLWNSLVADGGRESMCGWLTDRFGVSWQVVPEALMRLTSTGDPEATRRVFDAMMKMKKIVVADLEAAFTGAG